ncbi:MAG: preprotein translocase subunit SecY [Flavobacteriales bacterium]|jgi:preprotein translocase subunit SecY|nr:preprotein translocase subunit SecY [Flavobacteriales bacterium]NCG30302.1 preprotein translocase subunit SecY [Bacteroidota bacterium]MBT4704903.1 preprotein translocase subunit SecY [Flavobacteriales bacterium]MBT4929678.1 preprotein translocase subunit SecY [Flavobacteriales bacterium]MBT5132880.1 preprotein translocase subunit SecY [Flavobacteriales bacterium]
MKRFIETLQNIWKIEDLRVRILNTLGFLLIYRLGSFIVLPGVDPAVLGEVNQQASGIAALLNIFAGGAFSRASIFALGIMPYISASIVMQLAGIAVPSIQKMQREGESGRRRLNQWTRILTIAITAFQAPSYISTQIPAQAVAGGTTTFWWIGTIVLLVTGTIFVMWLGEKITDKGIGNGISMIIMIGIIAQLPTSFAFEWTARLGAGGFVMLLVEMVFLLLITIATVALVQGTRRIPVNFAKKVVGNKQYGGVRQYIPLKVNAAGVMPIIFAQALMFLPITFVGLTSSDAATGFASAFSDITGFWYNFIFFILIIAFTYFYTAITVNPNQMAEDLKRNGGFIPGVKPGKKTSEFLDSVLSRITLPGSIFLGLVAILPAFAMIAGVSTGFAYFFGGTSLLIMVGVILDTLQQIESHLLMRHYDGLMKSGKIKGRSGSSAFGMAG